MSAYTSERYQRACKLFLGPRTEVKEDPRLDVTEWHLWSGFFYDLRPRPSHANSKTVACLDDDKTGDYNPYDGLTTPKRKLGSNPAECASERHSKRLKAAPTSQLIALQRRLVQEVLNASQQINGHTSHDVSHQQARALKIQFGRTSAGSADSSMNIPPVNMTALDGNGGPILVGQAGSPLPTPIYELVRDVGPGLPPVLIRKEHTPRPARETLRSLAGEGNGRPTSVGLRTTSQSFEQKENITRSMPILTSDNSHPWDEPRPFLVQTELPHPLTVMYDSSGPGCEPCHWCDNFAYGIVGLGVRYVEVLERRKGQWAELRYGHTHEGKEPSRMCIRCSLNRINIILCAHDNLVPLVDNSIVQLHEVPIFEELAKASQGLKYKPKLVNQTGQSFPEPIHPWCSLCQSPAHWRCDEPQYRYHRQEPVDIYPLVTGCGLHLCNSCAEHTKRFGGDLDAVYKQGIKDLENGVKIRADVNYILRMSESNVFWQIMNKKKN